MGIFNFERLFDLNHDGTLDPLEKGLEFTVIEDIMNDDEDNDDLFCLLYTSPSPRDCS
mgnify:CR=1 FL=1